MVRYYKNADNKLIEASAAEPGTWVNMINPTEEELNAIGEELKIDASFLHAALDEEETSHIDCEENQTLIIIDVPVAETGEKNNVVFATLPVGIIVTTDNVVTVSLKETSAFREIAEGKVKNVFPVQKTKFVLQVLLRVAKRYLYYLKQIDKISHFVEKQLHKSMKNKELFQLLELEKSLVYFSTSLQSDSITIKKILSGKVLKLYEEDQDLLDDVLIEINQAIEMSHIYSSILTGTMDAFASVISNNLNIVMKVLTSVTILLTIPNVIFSYYGMNVSGLPVPVSWFPPLFAAAVTVITGIILRRRDLI
ncbi:MAG: magnesium transporter CorA family protein [Clostridiales bacterium]|jgi:magnesium transporter|nr:magnesium transporter CorA family protein [Clostridiales bacterium]